MLSSCKEDYFRKYLKKGTNEFSKKNYKLAICYYDTALTFDAYPYLKGIVYSSRGEAKYKIGDYLGAINDCENSLNLNSSTVDDYNEEVCFIGNIKLQIGNYPSAIVEFNKIINGKSFEGKRILDTDDFRGISKDFYGTAFYSRALAEYELKKYNNAIKDCDSAIAFNNTLSGNVLILQNKINLVKEN